MTAKDFVKQIPVLEALVRRVRAKLAASRQTFCGSAAYWEKRYSAGGNSGAGSEALLAKFKAQLLNSFVATHQVRTVIEFGCGDGNQLMLAKYPRYLGLDVSRTAISRCRERFDADGTKRFCLMSNYAGDKGDLTLSLDVIYHLVEDNVFEDYMRALFEASNRYVIIYTSDFDDKRGYDGAHVRHRKFTKWTQDRLPDWSIVEHVPNRYPYRWYYPKGSVSEFFIYQRRAQAQWPTPPSATGA
jgi:hypothetical protein